MYRTLISKLIRSIFVVLDRFWDKDVSEEILDS